MEEWNIGSQKMEKIIFDFFPLKPSIHYFNFPLFQWRSEAERGYAL
jgi:hypothetical protein